ncbi:MAG: hypothetical protein QOF46_3074 [Paraburkholderia sp.]|nr:hypothetical protein [Paraburkholderia sp.]
MRMVNPISIAADFGTQRALSGWMIGIANDLERSAALDSHAHRTGIRAIVRAHGAGEFSWGIHWRFVRKNGKR